MDSKAQNRILTKNAMLIINPVSGKKTVLRYIPQIITQLMDAGFMVSTFVTSSRADATEFVKAYGERFELICCAGGDGTLNETLSGLAHAGLRRPLGYIACGSTNDFAMTHGLATDIAEAAANIVSGRSTTYDIGRFGDHFFSYVAAFGAFSWLSYTTDQNMKNLLGHTAYILDAIKDLYKIKPLHLRFDVDGRLYEDNYIFGAVCNTTRVAGTIDLPRDIVNTRDGKFEVLLIKMPKTVLELDMIVRGVLAQDYSCPFIDFMQGENIYIENPPGLEWSLDGECPGSYDNVHISPMPGFLELWG